MRRRRKRANRWAVLLLALTLAAGIVLFTAHLHRIFLEYAINECEDNALMEIGSLMEDEVYAHPERYASLVQLDYDSERHVTALRTDVVAIGRIKSRLVNGLYDRLDEFEQTLIEVPLGSVLAPRFFSGRGPSLHFGLAGLTQMEAEFVSSFSAAGINQTRHCILSSSMPDSASSRPSAARTARSSRPFRSRIRSSSALCPSAMPISARPARACSGRCVTARRNEIRKIRK